MSNPTSTLRGITINSSLNMCENFAISFKNSSTRLNLLKRVRYFINYQAALAIYKTMVIPTLTYCPLIITSSINKTLNTNICIRGSRGLKRVITEDIDYTVINKESCVERINV